MFCVWRSVLKKFGSRLYSASNFLVLIDIILLFFLPVLSWLKKKTFPSSLHILGHYVYFQAVRLSNPDPMWTTRRWVWPGLQQVTAVKQISTTLFLTNSCLVRIFWIVISSKVLSSQLASLLPLMEVGQGQGKWMSDRGYSKATLLCLDLSLQCWSCYRVQNLIVALLLLLGKPGHFSCLNIQRTHQVNWDLLLPSSRKENLFGSVVRWDPTSHPGCFFCQTLWLPRKPLECPLPH